MTKQVCQNCKKDFIIDQDDFDFYDKMQVPAPTFCPECRFQRRLMFKNERLFYKRDCDLCGKNTIAIFSPEKPFPVYCPKCWWSDDWDDGEYYLDYDTSKHIFDQIRELQKKTPHMALVNDYSTLVRSDYVNHAGSLKDCYLVFNADFNENVAYSNIVVRNKDSMDLFFGGDSQLAYECSDFGKLYNSAFSRTLEDCTDTYFSRDVTGLANCFGCVNLRNKSYHIFNEPYSKEEYEKKIKEFRLDTWTGLQNAKKLAHDFWKKHPYRFMSGSAQNVNTSGDYVGHSKNARDCFLVHDVEDVRYCQFLTMKPVRDCYDHTEWGHGAERVVDTLTTGEGTYNVKYCAGAWGANTLNVEYGMYNVSCQNSFACVNLKKKQYRILNKQYSPEEYKKLREELITKMNQNPYTDSSGRIWKYGDFLPYDLSPFAYNESMAYYFWDLNETEVRGHGWDWREPTPGIHKITMTSDQIPDSIHDIEDSILKEVLGCRTCGKAFLIIRMELELLRRFGFPVPRDCADCRYRERLSYMNPPRLYTRKCDKCGKDIQTSYAPDRPEIVYCETCYQDEVI